ncbi:hypothetical protein ABIF42_007423 [Bradyrhizobium diazoefficiens]
MMRMLLPLSSASSIGLAAPASNALVCCGKLENRKPRSKVPTSGVRLAEIDEPDTMRSMTPSFTELMTSISWPSWLSGKNATSTCSPSPLPFRFLTRLS